MEIRFLGPLGKVTGSCAWMRDVDRGWNFLVDCGMQQGEPTAESWNTGDDWPFDPAELDFMVLTHAHTDHSGLIPELYKRGFKGTVYCTKETREVAMLLLRDAARFTETPYEEEDLEAIKWHAHGGKTKFGGYHPVSDDLFIQYFRSGHIIGAASVKVLWGPKGSDQKSIIFSGDIGPGAEDREVLPFLRYPLHPKPADFVVLESTYGDRVRDEGDKDPGKRRRQLKSLLDQVVESAGTLAIPAFAVGRTQEVMFDLHCVVASDPERYQRINFLLDSASGQKMNMITADALKEAQAIEHTGKVRPLWLGKQVFRDLGLDGKDPDHMQYVRDVCDMTFSQPGKDRKDGVAHGNSVARCWKGRFTWVKDRQAELNAPDTHPRVVVMGSGTADGGAAATWLPTLLQSDKNIVAMSGHCSPDTVGGQLLEIRKVEPKERAALSGQLTWQSMGDRPRARLPMQLVRARITKLSGYSGHGDQTDLLNWVVHQYKGKSQVMGRTVFLQHGEDRAREGLSQAINKKLDELDLAADVIQPDDASKWFDLELNAVSEEICREQRKARLKEEMRRLSQELAELQ